MADTSQLNPSNPADHLTTLPSEILQNIASYLYATHIPDKAFIELGLRHIDELPSPTAFPPDLPNLSLTCKRLYHQTNEWARHILLRHHPITKTKTNTNPAKKTKKTKHHPPAPTPLTILLHWTAQNCVFCNRASRSRSAILMNGLRCCHKCDEREWPDKITAREAKEQYRTFAAEVPQGLPHVRLRYGTHVSSRGACEAVYARGDLEAFTRANRVVFDEGLRKMASARELDAQILRNVEVLRAAVSSGVFVDEDGQLAVRG